MERRQNKAEEIKAEKEDRFPGTVYRVIRLPLFASDFLVFTIKVPNPSDSQYSENQDGW
jgi:hypothetical protein